MLRLTRRMTDVKNLRVAYHGLEVQLLEKDVDKDPITTFRRWFEEAVETNKSTGNVMNIATINASNRPSSRMVLCKEITKDGNLLFFSNKESKKGTALKHNPYIAANFYWHESHRQVRIEGTTTQISEQENDDYYFSRPRESQAA